MLITQGLFVGYNARPVVEDLSITVGKGQVVSLLGPNGAGKTTTLMGVAGAIKPLRGTVSLAGDERHLPLHKRARRGLAFVTEERSVFKALTTSENLRAGGVDPDDVLEIFPELESRLNIRGGLLSGGEQQMLTLGRALARKPTVLLADELSLGLAPLIVRRLLLAVRAAADGGCAVLLVEQHVRQALKISDEAHVLNRGRIALSGSADYLSQNIHEVEAKYLSSASS